MEICFLFFSSRSIFYLPPSVVHASIYFGSFIMCLKFCSYSVSYLTFRCIHSVQVSSATLHITNSFTVQGLVRSNESQMPFIR
jgi:hypothetical protein